MFIIEVKASHSIMSDMPFQISYEQGEFGRVEIVKNFQTHIGNINNLCSCICYDIVFKPSGFTFPIFIKVGSHNEEEMIEHVENKLNEAISLKNGEDKALFLDFTVHNKTHSERFKQIITIKKVVN